jgi:hypothetical protein
MFHVFIIGRADIIIFYIISMTKLLDTDWLRGVQLFHLLYSFWNQWCFLQSDWFTGVRFQHESHCDSCWNRTFFQPITVLTSANQSYLIIGFKQPINFKKNVIWQMSKNKKFTCHEYIRWLRKDIVSLLFYCSSYFIRCDLRYDLRLRLRLTLRLRLRLTTSG